MKKVLVVIFALVIFCSCTAKTQPEQTQECFALNTICRQTVYSGNADVMTEAEKLLFDIDARMSLYKENSEVDAINDSADFVKVSQDTYEVISLAKEVSVKTDGTFDITMGILTREWDIVNNPHVPADSVIQNLLQYVGYEKIELADGKVKTPKETVIDLGGIAKGYAADKVVELYHEKGVESAIINLGGNVYAIGKKPDGTRFKIGVADPENSADYFAIVELEDMALVTSGAYERNFTQDGILYHHILDPETGYPSDSDLKSVSIICKESAVADALSTSVFILGSEKGLELIKQFSGVDAILVTNDNKVIVTEGIQNCGFQIINENYEYSEAY